MSLSLFPELHGYLPIFPHSEHLIIFVSTLLYLRNSTAFLHIRHLSLSSSSSSVCKQRKHIQTAMLHTSLPQCCCSVFYRTSALIQPFTDDWVSQRFTDDWVSQRFTVDWVSQRFTVDWVSQRFTVDWASKPITNQFNHTFTVCQAQPGEITAQMNILQ